MVRVRLPHVHRVRWRLSSGETVEYHSIRGKPGSRFWKTGDSELGSPDYLAAYQAAARVAPPAVRTFGAIVDAYLDSAAFRGLAPRTQADYLRWIEAIRRRFGAAPAEAFNRPEIRHVARKWRDQWSGKSAVYAWTVLRLVVAWAVEERLLREHHLRGGTRGLYAAKRAEIVWTETEVARFCDGAPGWLRRALTLAVETGLRPGDLVALTRFDVKPTPRGRQLFVRTGKSGGRQWAAVPVTPAAGAVIDATPAERDRILVGEHGGPLEPQWLSKAVKRRARAVGLRAELRLYDARGSAVTRLWRAGAAIDQMALAFGWSPSTAADMIRHYAALDPSASDEVLSLLERRKG